MMDIRTIRDESRRAARAHKEPFIIEREDLEDARSGNPNAVKIPFIGTYRPKGWKGVNLETWFPTEAERAAARVYYGDNPPFGAFFVDSSGFGTAGEPALTLKEFLGFIRPGFGYAVVEAGQFQVKVGVFERVL